MTNLPLVILLGVISTIQTHLAKALERQGIDVFEQVKARLQRNGNKIAGCIRKPVIYTIGFILNHTVFIWAILAQPYGPPALFTSMFGVGLVFMLLYAIMVMKEKIAPVEIWGIAAVLFSHRICSSPFPHASTSLATLRMATKATLPPSRAR